MDEPIRGVRERRLAIRPVRKLRRDVWSSSKTGTSRVPIYTVRDQLSLDPFRDERRLFRHCAVVGTAEWSRSCGKRAGHLCCACALTQVGVSLSRVGRNSADGRDALLQGQRTRLNARLPSGRRVKAGSSAVVGEPRRTSAWHQSVRDAVAASHRWIHRSSEKSPARVGEPPTYSIPRTSGIAKRLGKPAAKAAPQAASV